MLRPDLIVLAGEIETAVARIHAECEAGTLTLEILRSRLEAMLATAATLRVAEDALRLQGSFGDPDPTVISLNDERNRRAVAALYRALDFPPVTGAPALLPSDNLRPARGGLWTPADPPERPA